MLNHSSSLIIPEYSQLSLFGIQQYKCEVEIVLIEINISKDEWQLVLK